MLNALNALQPKEIKKAPKIMRSKRIDTMVREPLGVKFVQYELTSGSKSRTYLLANVPVCKSALECALAYMYDKGMVTKKPNNPKNPRHGICYELVQGFELT